MKLSIEVRSADRGDIERHLDFIVGSIKRGSTSMSFTPDGRLDGPEGYHVELTEVPCRECGHVKIA